MIEKAIAAIHRYLALPEGDEPKKRNAVEIRKRKKTNAELSQIYADATPEWIAYASAEPRTMRELEWRMFELSGHKPSESAMAKWAEQRSITIRSSVPKLGLGGDIGMRLAGKHAQGASYSDLVVWCATTLGIVVTERQISGAVYAYRRKIKGYV